jgi:hypothetical protein
MTQLRAGLCKPGVDNREVGPRQGCLRSGRVRRALRLSNHRLRHIRAALQQPVFPQKLVIARQNLTALAHRDLKSAVGQ